MRISISEVSCYKQCRRQYYLKYHLGLVPVQDAEALRIGTNYHSLVEAINKGEEIEFPKTAVGAMAWAYNSFIAPKVEVKAAEEWIHFPLGEGRHELIGRLDGIDAMGFPVEHKTTSGNIDERYLFDLDLNDQVMAYLLATGKECMTYTVCKKPTIRLRKNETEEEFFQRCCEWYMEDTDHKIKSFGISRSSKDIEAFEQELVAIADEMENCKLFYRNPSNCAMWSGCPYRSICLDKNPQPGAGFKISEYHRPKPKPKTPEPKLEAQIPALDYEEVMKAIKKTIIEKDEWGKLPF